MLFVIASAREASAASRDGFGEGHGFRFRRVGPLWMSVTLCSAFELCQCAMTEEGCRDRGRSSVSV